MSETYYKLSDLEKVLKACESYSTDNINDHITELDSRRQILNQTCVSTPDKLYYDRIDAQFNKLRNTYTNDYRESLEEKVSMMAMIRQIQNDMLKLEKKQGKQDNE